MRLYVSAMLALALTSTSTAYSAPPRKSVGKAAVSKAMSKEDLETCKALAADYEKVSKNLAKISSAGRGDSAATVAQAQITISLMSSTGCKLPSHAPSKERYALAALRCETAQAKRENDDRWEVYNGRQPKPYEIPPECDTGLWQPN